MKSINDIVNESKGSDKLSDVIKKLDDYIDMGLKFVQNLWKSICSFFD